MLLCLKQVLFGMESMASEAVGIYAYSFLTLSPAELPLIICSLEFCPCGALQKLYVNGATGKGTHAHCSIVQMDSTYKTWFIKFSLNFFNSHPKLWINMCYKNGSYYMMSLNLLFLWCTGKFYCTGKRPPEIFEFNKWFVKFF